ncbi:Hit zinc finger and papa-1-like domain-containing protein, partial [Thalictrum thalictroides]
MRIARIRRQRALQSGKDTSTSLIEFPNGLPPAPSRKQKEKLSEVEQQLKKAEAAQRRRMQMEKAARESE